MPKGCSFAYLPIWCKIYTLLLLAIIFVLPFSTPAYSVNKTVKIKAGWAFGNELSMNNYAYIKPSDTLSDLLNHPAFAGFGQHLLTRDSDISKGDLPLTSIQSLLPYHGFVDPDTIVNAINHMVEEVNRGKTIFYSFYTEPQKRNDPDKNSTGLFFFRGKQNAPFAII